MFVIYYILICGELLKSSKFVFIFIYRKNVGVLRREISSLKLPTSDKKIYIVFKILFISHP